MKTETEQEFQNQAVYTACIKLIRIVKEHPEIAENFAFGMVKPFFDSITNIENNIEAKGVYEANNFPMWISQNGWVFDTDNGDWLNFDTQTFADNITLYGMYLSSITNQKTN